jgi:hypothetical protein
MASYGIGELTAPGFRQHWVLGNLLREKYSSVFDHRFKLAEISSRSTGFDRTIQSANAHLEGIFSLFPTDSLLRHGPDAEGNLPVWRDPGFNFYKLLDFETPLPHRYEPYPVYSPNDGHFDRFLKADDEGGLVCNATFPLRAAASEKFEKYINGSQLLQDTCKEAYERYDMYDAEIEKYGFNFTNSFFIADAVLCLHENDPQDGLNMEDPADALFYLNIRKVYSQYIFQFYNNTEYLKTVQTPILNDLRLNLNQKVDIALGTAEPSTNELKYRFLSSHDSTIAQIFLNNGFFDGHCLVDEMMDGVDRHCHMSPGPSASLIFELVQQNTKNPTPTRDDFVIRSNYDGVYVDFCKTGKPGPHNKFDCKIEKFNEILDLMAVPDFDKACFGPVVPGQGQQIAAASAGVNGWAFLLKFVGAGLVIGVLCWLVVKRWGKGRAIEKKRSLIQIREDDNVYSVLG